MTDSFKDTNSVWRFFSSVRLTLVLLFLLALVSIFGTLIPQQQGAMEFAQKLSPATRRLFELFDLFDLYHSYGFRLIISFLVLNLLICSINRFSMTWTLFRTKPRPDRSRPFSGLPPHRTVRIQGRTRDAGEEIKEILQGSYRGLVEKSSQEGRFLYAEKGRLSLFGVYLVHFSVLLILIGAMIGSFLGFEAYTNLPVGRSTDTVRLIKTGAHKKLEFTIHCDDFHVSFYENGTPREYRSDLRITMDGKPVKKGAVRVNHPMTFRGVALYQSSYGTIPGNRLRLTVVSNQDENERFQYQMETEKAVELPKDKGTFTVDAVRDDFMKMGPAAQITVRPIDGKETRFWLFQRQDMIEKRFPGLFQKFPKLNPAAYEPYHFYLDELETSYYTGLQVNKDPGVPFVWSGFFMIMTGLFVTFFMSHRGIWIRITPNHEEWIVSVAGRSNKNPVGLDRELDQLVQKIDRKLS